MAQNRGAWSGASSGRGLRPARTARRQMPKGSFMKRPRATILRPSTVAPHERGNGARTTPLVTSLCGSTSILNGITEFDPGGSIALHAHNCEESVIVLEGEAVLHVDGAEYFLGATDATFIPANVPHFFRNASQSGKMRIFWTYASIDATRISGTGGQVRRIDEEPGHDGREGQGAAPLAPAAAANGGARTP
jgi:putative monooxygenase